MKADFGSRTKFASARKSCRPWNGSKIKKQCYLKSWGDIKETWYLRKPDKNISEFNNRGKMNLLSTPSWSNQISSFWIGVCLRNVVCRWEFCFLCWPWKISSHLSHTQDTRSTGSRCFSEWMKGYFLFADHYDWPIQAGESKRFVKLIGFEFVFFPFFIGHTMIENYLRQAFFIKKKYRL